MINNISKQDDDRGYCVLRIPKNEYIKNHFDQDHMVKIMEKAIEKGAPARIEGSTIHVYGDIEHSQTEDMIIMRWKTGADGRH